MAIYWEAAAGQMSKGRRPKESAFSHKRTLGFFERVDGNITDTRNDTRPYLTLILNILTNVELPKTGS